MAVDLFCGGVQQRHKRISKRNLSLQDGLSEAVIKSRYGFSRNYIQFGTGTLVVQFLPHFLAQNNFAFH